MVGTTDQNPCRLSLSYEQGGLILDPVPEALKELAPSIIWDPRTLQYRAPANAYREIVLACQRMGNDFILQDQVRQYEPLDLEIKTALNPRPHQTDALAAWLRTGQQGVISLPTGAGKTILAIFAMEKSGRSTLVVVPTIDLMHQWASVISTHLGIASGLLGGGSKDIKNITIATYDSAKIFSEALGCRFGLLIFDECHHLPASGYRQIASQSAAPFRLGLSATVERPDGGEELLYNLVGPLCYRGGIREMTDNVLSPYDVVHIGVELTEKERLEYQNARKIYTDFVWRQGIDFRRPDGWTQFIIRAARNQEGRIAFRNYRKQKKLAQAAQGKLDEIWKILNLHSGEPMIIFTEDNEMAYKIGRNFFLAVLTHKTKAKERKRLLDNFRGGLLRVLVTSKVLNEGVDVPEARVGVVVSGSGTVREHVQRLGRILRHQPGKRAVLYEIVSKNTSEQYVNKRRREHDAYKMPSEI